MLPQEFREYDLVCQEPYDGFMWKYNKCTRRILGVCLKTEHETIKIKATFEDKDLLKELCAMNFVLSKRETISDIP